MIESSAIIERVKRISSTHQHLHLSVEPTLTDIKPGQSLLTRIGEGWQPYLRERWYPVGIERDGLIIERPTTTQYDPGTVVRVIGAIGQPMRFRRTLRTVLLIAHDSAPTPLIMPINALIAKDISVTLLLLGSAKAYDTKHLPAEVEVMHGDGDGMDWSNRVTTIAWADQVFAVVDADDEIGHFTALYGLFRQLRSDIPQAHLWSLWQMPFVCGVGACGACYLKRRGGEAPALACVDGAVFDMTTLSL